MQKLQFTKSNLWPIVLFLIALLMVIGFATETNATTSSATQTAEYQVVFDATWDPDGVPSPHFSRLVGGTHNADTVIWERGGLASDGMEVMAESGGTSTLLSEIRDNANANQTLLGDPIPVSPGTGDVDAFTADLDYPLLTLVTMIAPSPDWFVGVSGLSLLDEQGEWRDEIVVQLLPYDAGTDSGPDFTSVNDDTNPAEAIFLIEDAGLFPDGALGTFTITRLDAPEPTPEATATPEPTATPEATATMMPPFVADNFIYLPIVVNE